MAPLRCSSLLCGVRGERPGGATAPGISPGARSGPCGRPVSLNDRGPSAPAGEARIVAQGVTWEILREVSWEREHRAWLSQRGPSACRPWRGCGESIHRRRSACRPWRGCGESIHRRRSACRPWRGFGGSIHRRRSACRPWRGFGGSIHCGLSACRPWRGFGGSIHCGLSACRPWRGFGGSIHCGLSACRPWRGCGGSIHRGLSACRPWRGCGGSIHRGSPARAGGTPALPGKGLFPGKLPGGLIRAHRPNPVHRPAHRLSPRARCGPGRWRPSPRARTCWCRPWSRWCRCSRIGRPPCSGRAAAPPARRA